jgi:hypothetical protein
MIVTCMASRVVHIEMLDDLSTDALINAICYVIAIHGPIRSKRCDQGSNLIGAKSELKESLHANENNKLRHYLIQNNCDFILNPPHSSHMGGVCERHIRTIRSILTTMLNQHGPRLEIATLRNFCMRLWP